MPKGLLESWLNFARKMPGTVRDMWESPIWGCRTGPDIYTAGMDRNFFISIENSFTIG